MKQIYILSILFLIGCSAEDTTEIFTAEEFNYVYFDKLQEDSIHCIQVGSSTITPFNTISLQNIKHELVDTTHALVKIKGHIISINNDEMIILIKIGNDTITANLFEKTNSPIAFVNKPAVFSGEIQVHPELNFELDSYLVFGIKKAPFQEN